MNLLSIINVSVLEYLIVLLYIIYHILDSVCVFQTVYVSFKLFIMHVAPVKHLFEILQTSLGIVSLVLAVA